MLEQIRQGGLPVEVTIEGDVRPLAPGIEVAAYRIVQEALTNALKHAGHARATVTIRYESDAVALEIQDNGTGTTSATGGGHGLVGMRERVALFGGELHAGRGLTGGWTLRARLPSGAT